VQRETRQEMSLLSRGYNRSPCGRKEKEDRRFHYRLRCPRARSRARLCRSISGGLTKLSVCFSLNCALTSNPLNLERPCRLAAYSSHSRHRPDFPSHSSTSDRLRMCGSYVSYNAPMDQREQHARSKCVVRAFLKAIPLSIRSPFRVGSLRRLSGNRVSRLRAIVAIIIIAQRVRANSERFTFRHLVTTFVHSYVSLT